MRLLYFVLLTLSGFIARGQNSRAVNMRIIEEGLCRVGSAKCVEKGLRYMKACEQVGNYYYQLKNYRAAFKFYSLVADLSTSDVDGDFEEDERLLKLHTVLCWKVGDMLFAGLGVKANRVAAYYYHNSVPFYLTKKKREQFSQLHFNTTDKFYAYPAVMKRSDSSQQFSINPFFIYDPQAGSRVCKELQFFDEKLQADTALKCHMVMMRGCIPMSELGQSYLNRFQDNLPVLKESKFASRYTLDIEFNDSTSRRFNGIQFPTLVVTLSRF